MIFDTVAVSNIFKYNVFLLVFMACKSIHINKSLE